MTPRFTHDCTNCRFLGRISRYDLYRCEVGNDWTGIARRSSDGPDYSSIGFLKSKVQDMHRETGGLTDDQAFVLALFRAMPSLILNIWEKP
jgi:hypothetical protein